MSIESEITRINNNIAATYTALSAKGATMPATENSANLASTVATVPSGGSVDPSRLVFEVNDGVASKPAVTLNENSFAGITSVGSSALSYSYNRSVVSGVVSFPDLTTVDSNGLNTAFRGSSVTKAMFPALTLAQSNSFYNTFSGCVSLSSVDFSSLESIGDSTMKNFFSGCTRLTTISFPSLTTVKSNSLSSCFYNCTNLTSIHFLASMQSTIEGLSGYSSKFGASNATIYFDL